MLCCKSESCQKKLSEVEVLYIDETEGSCNECLKKFYAEVKGNLTIHHYYSYKFGQVEVDNEEYANYWSNIVKIKILDLLHSLTPSSIVEYFLPQQEGQFIVAKKDWLNSDPDLIANDKNCKIVIKVDKGKEEEEEEEEYEGNASIFSKKIKIINFNTGSYYRKCEQTGSMKKVQGYWVKDSYKNPKRLRCQKPLSGRIGEMIYRKHTLYDIIKEAKSSSSKVVNLFY